MKQPFPKAVIFDWDNTLVDSWPVISQSINYIRAKYGLQVWSMDEIMVNCTRAARASFPEWFGDQWEEAYKHYYAHFDNLRKSHDIRVMNGAFELLQWLKDQRIPCFVVSNKSGDYLRHEVDRLQWQDYFVAVAGAADAPRDKPYREHVDHALKDSGITPDESVWFVGDSEADIACARNSGCTPVFIGRPDEAEKHKVDLVFPDCHALQTLLYNRLNDNKTAP